MTGESGERIGILKTDGGGEYKSREFAQYLIRHQIEHKVTVPDSPEMNGLAERMNRTILEKAKCMCVHAGLPYSLWAEAANTATFIYNRLPNAPLKGKSPYELWYGRKPDLSNLKVFGCVAYALVPAAKRRKFGDKTEKMRFLGYHKGHRGYRLMELGGNRVFYRTDITFNEHNFRLTPVEDERRVMETLTVEVDVYSSGRRAGQPAPEVPVAVPDRVPARLRVMPEMVAVPNEPQPELAAVHSRPTRMKKPIDRYGVDEQAKVVEVEEEVKEVIASALCAAEMDEPKTLREARKRPDASKWLAAAQEEMDSLMEHETWSLTKLPPGRKIVGSKWVFKVKLDENGEAARYKCRLMAQGYTQAQGVDYHETFAPVARFGSSRTLLATAAQRGMHVHQMDVHMAFLNGKLEEDIYMCQPEGFVVEGKEEQVCHLHRSLYGLKQSPRCWNRELSCHLLDSGFEQSKADPCVYFQWKNGNLNIVSIYVDDLILVVDLLKDLEQTKEELSARFKMKDLGQLRYCLGIVCDQSTGCIKLNQIPYIDNLVRRFGLDKACGVSTPADACVKTGGRRWNKPASRPKIVPADCGKPTIRRRRDHTRHRLRCELRRKVLQPAHRTALDSSETSRELSQADQRPQFDLCQEYPRSHHRVLRCRLGRRCEGQTIHFWERVPVRRSCDHLVKQETKFCCVVHGRSRIHGAQCRNTGGHMATPATRGAWNEGRRSDTDLRKQSGCYINGEEPGVS